jgi:AcrR family transcriptional regulator
VGVREQLVTAGVDLLERDGLAQLTQRRIATMAGVSHGAPRHYFPTYASLLAAIAREGINDMDRIIRDSLSEPDARTALTNTCRNVLTFATNRPAMFELISRHDLLEGTGENLRATTGPWVNALTERIRDVRQDAQQRHTLALWAGVQGLGVMLGRRGVEAITDQQVAADPILAVLVDGILRASD